MPKNKTTAAEVPYLGLQTSAGNSDNGIVFAVVDYLGVAASVL